MSQSISDLQKALDAWSQAVSSNVYNPQEQHTKDLAIKNLVVVRYRPRFRHLRPGFCRFEWINRIFYRKIDETILENCWIASIRQFLPCIFLKYL